MSCTILASWLILYISYLSVAPLTGQTSMAESASCTGGSVERAARWATPLPRGAPACPARTTVSFATVHTSAPDVPAAISQDPPTTPARSWSVGKVRLLWARPGPEVGWGVSLRPSVLETSVAWLNIDPSDDWMTPFVKWVAAPRPCPYPLPGFPRHNPESQEGS